MSQIKIVKGNDAPIQWRVSYQGQPLDLTGKAVTLYVINSRGPFQLKNFEVEGHVVTATYYGADQTRFGEHSLVLRLNEGRPEMSTVAVKEAFELVEWSKDQGGESGEPIKVTPIILEADVAVAQGGGSSYDDTELRNEIAKKQDKAVVFTPELLGDPIAVYESEGAQRLGYSQSQIEGVLGKPIEEVYQEWKDREVVLSALSYSYYALNKGVREDVKMLVMNYTDPSEESDMEYVLSLYVNGATLNGQRVYIVLEVRPATSGVSKEYVDGKLTELSAEVGNKQDTISDLETIRSGASKGATAIQEVKTINGQSIVGSGNIEIQGGGGGGMTTPSGDPMHYMFEAAGATYNATDADIPMVGVYGDSYIHKAKHWHLNELGDITNEEMRKIFLYANLDNGAKGYGKYLGGIETRTNIATWSSSWNGKIKDQEVFSYADKVIVARLRDREHYIDTNASFAFISCEALQKVLPTLDATATTSFNGTFDNCKNLREVRIKNVKVAIKFDKSPMISKASILYLIQNSAATSAMVITLHADAYARLAEDADIVAALAEKTNVSLAK